MKKVLWTIERIREGFERFNNEYGRLPTALEVDRLEYLPSSRHIQVKFGGLQKLRSLLGYELSHFGKGTFRSEIARRVNGRGRTAELALESALQDIFGEVFVHTEKIFGTKSKHRVDFYVYSPDGNFGIDIFYPENIHTMRSNAFIKMNKYRDFPEDLYLVVANLTLKQEDLDTYSTSKRQAWPTGSRLVNLETLMYLLSSKRAYLNPLK